MRPKPGIQVKNAFLFGFNPLEKFLRPALKIIRGDPRGLPARWFARHVIDEQNLDIGGIS